MSIPLLEILNRLKSESLHGPISILDRRASETMHPWRKVSNEYTDLDSMDPRWFELFIEYFIDAKNQVVDDLLFFVRKYVPFHKSSSGSINESEPVIVKRRVAGNTPALNDIIDWKQSFFLNLICQLPCTLTVSVCTKSSNSDKKNGGMNALRRVTKKVYAAPFKSRMDVKDALMNECSYPLVYYTINDFESEMLQLKIQKDEYLCVELSLLAPKNNLPEDFQNASDKVSSITIEESSEPFPAPHSYRKVILFQGAVSFQALSTVYQQKGISHSSSKSIGNWNNLLESEKMVNRTEYIQMKGPQGTGQSQVAIQEPISAENIEDQPHSTIFGTVKNIIKSQLGSGEIKKTVSAPDVLQCSMTYVNVPWQSLVCDIMKLIDHGE